MNVYIHQVDDGLGGAEIWDDLGDGAAWGHPGATERPETAANADQPETVETSS
jgi:hypothetical protein